MKKHPKNITLREIDEDVFLFCLTLEKFYRHPELTGSVTSFARVIRETRAELESAEASFTPVMKAITIMSYTRDKGVRT